MSDSLSARLEAALLQAAAADGRPLALVSLAVDYGPAAGGEPTVTAAVDRTTRSLVFASGEARDPSGQLLAAASAVLRVLSA